MNNHVDPTTLIQALANADARHSIPGPVLSRMNNETRSLIADWRTNA